MANIKYQEEIYNKAFKNAFLAPYPEDTQKNYIRIFRISFTSENEQGKDLYDFSIDEIYHLLKAMKPATEKAAYANAHIIRLYINDAIVKRQKRDAINPLLKVTTEWIYQFCEGQSYFSESQIIDLEDSCHNKQDSVLIRLLFEGVHGTQYSEILNLRPNDIDESNNILFLNDNGGKTRELLVSDRCINMLQEAYAQEKYLKKNGQSKPGIKSHYANLLDTGYIIKLAEIGKQSGSTDQHAVLRRFKNIRFDGEIVSPKEIINSGIVRCAKDILVGNRVLTDESLMPIAERYQILNKYDLRKRASLDLIYKVYGEFIPVEEFELVCEDPAFNETEIKKREGQALFRKNLLEVYENKCSVSHEECMFVLEAAHIQNYINSKSNDLRNGLLLRADIHLLFDMGLITVDNQYNIVVSPQLDSKEYQSFQGKRLHLPANRQYHPSLAALEYHYNQFIDYYN